ncbi:MAG TPA: exodeoxyribonuclease I [Patescibacteria group bacterium]|nr:exodeoxyribonuclease I [Patescibacteria group bacterium]
MSTTFYFYDLETTGFSPREARIMQFGGQRTDLRLKPLGKPHNTLIKLTEDVLPDPDAVLLTGITPQKTLADGITEAEFLQLFTTEIAIPETIFVGFNSVRFDDEFMRFLHYRNFYDAYEWHWSDHRSRWDLLDVVRMTRALRPDGIKWPVDSNGKATNRLELLTSLNSLDHAHAHDALSDVQACIALAQLLQSKQPDLFTYLLEHRDKNAVKKLVNSNQAFVYTSGKYSGEYEKTTAVIAVCEHPKRGGAVVYDLRQDPTESLKLTPEALAKWWRHHCGEYPCPHPRIPLKTLQFNRCPAVAPLGVLREEDQKRLQLPLETISKHAKQLQAHPEFCEAVTKAVELLDKQQQLKFLQDELDADVRLYDHFIGNQDKVKMREVQQANETALATLVPTFTDGRLNSLWPLYKARNFPTTLTDEERGQWESFRHRKLVGGKGESRAAHYFERLAALDKRPDLTGEQRYLLEELQLYGQSVLPLTD